MTLQPPVWPSAGVCWARKGPAASAGLLGTGWALPESRGLAGCLPALAALVPHFTSCSCIFPAALSPSLRPQTGRAHLLWASLRSVLRLLPRCWSPSPPHGGGKCGSLGTCRQPSCRTSGAPALPPAPGLHPLCGGRASCLASRKSARLRVASAAFFCLALPCPCCRSVSLLLGFTRVQECWVTKRPSLSR